MQRDSQAVPQAHPPTPDFRAQALHTAALQPMTLQDSRVCWARPGDEQCKACVLRASPLDYTGQFPAVDVIVPNLDVKLFNRPDGTPYTEQVCRDRRTAGTVVPGPSVGGSAGGVGAHAYTVRQHTGLGNPLEGPVQGLLASRKAVLL